MFTRLGAILALSLMLVFPAMAEQKVTVGDYAIHYVSFGSTFLTPEIAKNYGLTRSRYIGLVNVSVNDTRDPDAMAIPVTITGYAQNLIGNQKTLDFKEIREGDAIYYFAELDHRNEETFTFNLTVSNGKDLSTKLSFKQKFYVD
ncbi:DUF4426 domain-containing protein [Ferrimonas aestuarii]|uniref:DUF4426 domain-containing protein n=1 Tax=Ferrimonas aestuarii TaxID=2569539 RepID=A0A4U1BG53_9GAMM|nr:DUF4426 domain-containing protein [Ferrimonas aestuarii]TKB50168.1 DUF4426 domain-containing protein [Ferrimonas aestuarii]